MYFVPYRGLFFTGFNLFVRADLRQADIFFSQKWTISAFQLSNGVLLLVS
jgi:hypothetical protein